MPDDLSISQFSRHGAAHPNPAYNFLTGFVPRRLKDLFRWAEYVYTDSPAIFSALQKLAAYPVTSINIDETDLVARDNWKLILNNNIKARSIAITTSLDKRIYGNSFISLYRPFTRSLICGHKDCNNLAGIAHVKYRFQLKTLKFKYDCPSCNRPTTGTISDQRSKDAKHIAVIRWDPKLIEIDYNPMTGKSVYYYTIPSDLKNKVTENNSHILNTMPIEFLKAMQVNKQFRFADGQIYHMKMPSPAGIDAQWGMPPLLCTIKLFFYAMVLRKANEAIALDHIVPFRVLHPAPISGTADPATQINLANWQAKMEQGIKAWRRDPLHIMFAPTALGVTTMGGQGRSLLTLGEVKDAEDTIIAGLGVPREFVYGGLSQHGSGVSLRMLENQLDTDSADQNEQLDWIISQVAEITGHRPVKANYVPFKLVDDAEQKGALMQLQQVLGNPMSADTMLKAYDIDPAKERDKKFQEQLDELRSQMRLQTESQKLMASASQLADQAAQAGQGLGYNPQAVLAQADQTVQQLSQMDPGTRRSQMDHLSQSDPVMYAVVKDRMESQAQMLKQQAGAQAMAESMPQ